MVEFDCAWFVVPGTSPVNVGATRLTPSSLHGMQRVL